MDDGMPERTIDLLYEASLFPDRWPEALHAAMLHVQASAALLIVEHKNEQQFYCTDAIAGTLDRAHAGGWLQTSRNIRRARFPKQRQNICFVRDLDVIGTSEIKTAPLYAKFLHQEGWGSNAGAQLILPDQREIIISFENRLEMGPLDQASLDRLNELAPHLERASRLSSRVGLARAASLVTTIEQLGLPACTLAADGSVIAANNAFAGLEPCVSAGAFDRLALSDAAAQKQIYQALRDSSAPGATPRPFPVKCSSPRGTIVLTVLPVTGNLRDIFTRATALLLVTPGARNLSQASELLEKLYGLTPTEARTACELASSMSIPEIARRHAVSVGTVRNHVKSTLAKADVRRQADLIAIINNLFPF
ncbi:DNA-binding protein [Camelimonas fluminis]|nr:DNA-binding protein [Camelimonas fluminis]